MASLQYGTPNINKGVMQQVVVVIKSAFLNVTYDKRKISLHKVVATTWELTVNLTYGSNYMFLHYRIIAFRIFIFYILRSMTSHGT